MATKHWSWGHFSTDNQLFWNNNSYKNAWCITCVNHRREQLWHADITDTVVSGLSSGRTEVDWEAQGGLSSTVLFQVPLGLTDRRYKIYIACRDCPPISGKPGQTMVPHLSKCMLVGLEVQN
jgi:hypothetical protein